MSSAYDLRLDDLLRPRDSRHYRRRPQCGRAVKITMPEILRWWRARGKEPVPVGWRPETRADCDMVPRPCPFVGCRHNLFLDISERTGSIKLNFPHLEPHEMQYSCALDVADMGGITLHVVGELMNVSRERVRQWIDEMAQEYDLGALSEYGDHPAYDGQHALEELESYGDGVWW